MIYSKTHSVLRTSCNEERYQNKIYPRGAMSDRLEWQPVALSANHSAPQFPDKGYSVPLRQIWQW